MRENWGDKGKAQVEALDQWFQCNPLSIIVYIESFQVRFCMSGEFYSLKRNLKTTGLGI